MQEKRFARRFNTNDTLQCLVADKKATISDISLTGTRLKLEGSYDLDKELELMFRFVPGAQIIVMAKPVWNRQDGEKVKIGVNFTKFSDSDKQKLYQFMFQRFKDEFKSAWWADT
ncbi:MAG: PilZ domain-containing protein [Candidatus Gygaella obscura]|nr:PilZ domain-containing protein [Candidatus Gygaella obscura]